MASDMLVTLTKDDLRGLILDAVTEALEGQGRASQAAQDVFTRKEAADFLRTSVATLDRLARDGEIPSRRVGDSPRYLRADLLAYVRGGAPSGSSLRAVGGAR